MLPAEDLRRSTSSHRAEPVEIWKAQKFIEQHSAEELSLGTVAKAVSFNANYFSERFKLVTGVNFVEYAPAPDSKKRAHFYTTAI